MGKNSQITSTIEGSSTSAFVLDSTRLERLEALLTEHSLTVESIEIFASDGSQTQYEKFADAHGFTNSKSRQITAIVVDAHEPLPAETEPTIEEGSVGEVATLKAEIEHLEQINSILMRRHEHGSGQRKLKLTLSANSRLGPNRWLFYGSTVKYLISGPDAFTLPVRRSVDEWAQEMRPAYAYFAESAWPGIVSKIALIGGASLLSLAFLPPLFLIGTVILAGYLLLSDAVTDGIGFIFPSGVFAFGKHGSERAENRSSVRNFVLVAVFVGVGVNLVSAVIYDWAGRIFTRFGVSRNAQAQAESESARDGGAR